MQWFKSLCLLLAALALSMTTAASAQLSLQPVLSGLQEPRFVTHAGDGSGRLFFVEKAGRIRVMAPGATTASVFLDLQGQVGLADEGGLLGLAFHPGYRSNGRFFVFYTRLADNALVLAEHNVTRRRNLADPGGRVLLVIPHPTYDNHNGGMLAFGGDGFLYIGTGDGGSQFGGTPDPSNNAQNIESLLGKILRIDVDGSDANAGTLYAAPADNPYVGLEGRDEIYAIGFRNPWRFSFDRSTQQMWLGDVGQATWEEINTPIFRGGNYGWRMYEGTGCTGLTGCVSGTLGPVHQYGHDVNNRCSITGGYVYRGTRGVLPSGNYVYGDFCSGEVFAWDGTQRHLFTIDPFSLVSFGEDEQGELLVVARGGSVSRLVSAAVCTLSISPARASFGATGGSGVLSVSVEPDCRWTVRSDAAWLMPTTSVGNGSADIGYTVAPYSGGAKKRVATLTVNGKVFTVTQSR